MLEDRSTYRIVTKDPTPSLERKMNSTLLSLHRDDQLPKHLYNQLRSTAGLTPRLYGLPKIHKNGTPLRPIVSFINSPTYNLSKHLASLLSPLVGHSSSAVKNSCDLASFVSSVVLSDDEVLVSFDVVSLFTKIPTELAVDVARRRLEEDETLPDRTTLTVDNIIALLDLCLKATYLVYRGRYYQQIFGTVMGSPVSVTVANLVMEKIQEQALSTYDPPPRFWKRYVDDALTALPVRHIQDFHNHINNINPHIKFTIEIESNNALPYLDVLLHHCDDSEISTSVYRKPTHTNKYLDFTSHHPLEQKISVIKSLFTRARTLSSSLVEQKREEIIVNQDLRLNGYPGHLVKRHREIHLLNQPEKPTEKNTIASIALPYISGVTENIRRILAGLDIRVSLYPHLTLRRLLMKPKDPVDDHLKKGVVYRIGCKDCHQSYIGQSGRSLSHRVQEHRRAVINADFNASALAEHAWNNGHRIDWDNASILAQNIYIYPRLYLESWFIQHQDGIINRESGILPVIYKCLMT